MDFDSISKKADPKRWAKLDAELQRDFIIGYEKTRQGRMMAGKESSSSTACPKSPLSPGHIGAIVRLDRWEVFACEDASFSQFFGSSHSCWLAETLKFAHTNRGQSGRWKSSK